jgi:hypothetical protein
MSSDEESLANVATIRKRQRALQLGPRKKPYAIRFYPVFQLLM